MIEEYKIMMAQREAVARQTQNAQSDQRLLAIAGLGYGFGITPDAALRVAQAKYPTTTQPKTRKLLLLCN